VTSKSGEAPVRVGLRVEDVTEAATFYAGLGFQPVASIPDAEDRPVMAILRRGDLQLLVDALVGLPFPDGERERRTRTGPRGLGVVVGIEVDEVDAAADYCRSAGCTITTEPVDAPWGERYTEVIDPYGYAWKFFQALADPPSDSAGTAHHAFFG
jgi:uncharacterized glyoxalase superfamily protein PhnB